MTDDLARARYPQEDMIGDVPMKASSLDQRFPVDVEADSPTLLKAAGDMGAKDRHNN